MPDANSFSVALLQLNSRDQVDRNLSECARWAEIAAEARPALIVLPENFAFFGSEAQKREIAERLGDEAAPIQKAVSSIARAAGATVVAGGFPEQSPEPLRPYNSCAVFSPTGDVLAAYRKIHLFDVDLPSGQRYRESEGVSAGVEPVVVDVGRTKVGLSICYDLRFPELYRALVDRGAEVLLVPAAFTAETGKHHWQVLLRARAIESLAWVLGAAQSGEHGLGRVTYGHSCAVDPWGTVVAEREQDPGVLLVSVDLDQVRVCRERLPSLRHRRLG